MHKRRLVHKTSRLFTEYNAYSKQIFLGDKVGNGYYDRSIVCTEIAIYHYEHNHIKLAQTYFRAALSDIAKARQIYETNGDQKSVHKCDVLKVRYEDNFEYSTDTEETETSSIDQTDSDSGSPQQNRLIAPVSRKRNHLGVRLFDNDYSVSSTLGQRISDEEIDITQNRAC